MARRHIEATYRMLNPEGHWFDKDTMRFFGTRIGACTRAKDGALLFITSEQPPYGQRGYAVRRMDCNTGNITGDVCEFKTYSQARAAMKKRATA